jgi:23S rRNA G2069 N7-methylase RlmK/C1962 C5-methylase RlmI
MKLNKISSKIISFVRSDVNDYMKEAISQGRTWDIVILDPPKLAPNRKVCYKTFSKTFPKITCQALLLI